MDIQKYLEVSLKIVPFSRTTSIDVPLVPMTSLDKVLMLFTPQHSYEFFPVEQGSTPITKAVGQPHNSLATIAHLAQQASVV